MAYFEAFRQKNSSDQVINPATEESLTLLRRIAILLKPLGQITGGGSNRLSVDVNSGTVTTVTTVNTVTSVNQLGGITTFDLLKAMSRTAYNGGVRSNITFS